jgi:dTDP-4-dehydrorhamnose reductase
VRILVTGAAGMLGRDLAQDLGVAGAVVSTVTRAELDLTDADACAKAADRQEVVVNAAAWTAVDDAEEREAEAFAVNGTGAANLARACDLAGARLVHISTDYVFDGSATRPYDETALLSPASAYGRSKAAGEWAVQALCRDSLVVRTAWLYGAHGRCFPRTIAAALAERPTLDVVADQQGQPTWTRDVAELVRELLAARAPAGTYHATSSGQTSWHGFARAVAVSTGADPARVRETTSAAYVRPAARPAYSVLGHRMLEHAGVAPIGPWLERWEVAAATVLADLQPGR